MFTSQRFADRTTARSHMRKTAKEVYNLNLPETLSITEDKISLNCRHTYFKANTVYEVWKVPIKDGANRILICDISTGNIELINQSDFN